MISSSCSRTRLPARPGPIDAEHRSSAEPLIERIGFQTLNVSRHELSDLHVSDRQLLFAFEQHFEVADAFFLLQQMMLATAR